MTYKPVKITVWVDPENPLMLKSAEIWVIGPDGKTVGPLDIVEAFCAPYHVTMHHIWGQATETAYREAAEWKRRADSAHRRALDCPAVQEALAEKDARIATLEAPKGNAWAKVFGKKT